MLTEIFNNPDVAKAGLLISGAVIYQGLRTIFKAANSFNEHKGLGRIRPTAVALAGLVVAGVGGYGALEAWPRSDGSPANAAVAQPSDFPLAPEPESAPPGP